MTYDTIGALDLSLLEKIKAGQMPSAQDIISSDMLPFILAAISIPVAIIIARKLKRRKKKK
jgi:biotin transporter BioY